ncbi:non-ribosomal peptide synthetase [Mucilaginibacter aquaedulcis]|uniref:non-ribosomal peptide synthetase n=1 Tax=Mucilaginibacter aquaedulcis TaxID=1187081 RepID=UPI0025B2F1A3|nr:non-ribosomal peptide synthetase [Mucilaginibacter aquaedulcis]MDN3546955.1 amino acid adenylation domain-containing protein [Mucilaginibacter aquaedulcis]
MNKNQVEDIYTLSPMQEGMLFHMLAQPEAEAYFEQVSCDFEGEINLAGFQQAWQEIVDRYAVFRTSFHWDGLDKPVQVVHKTATLPWETLDWSMFDQNKINEKFDLLLRDDRRHGFDHEQAPLMRCILINTGKNSWKFIWSHHHMLMDGWCSGIVLDELFKRYKANLVHKPVHFPATPPFKNYITWLGKQDQEKAKAFWKNELAGFNTPTALGIGNAVLADKYNISHGYAECSYDLSPELSASILEWTKQNGITANVLMQGIWAILLSTYSGENRVVFGATVSGRPPELPNVESIVGLFINSLPVKADISHDTDMVSWLKYLQARNNERNEFSFTPLVDIKKASDVSGDAPLFRSLLVFENYPFDAAAQQGFDGLEIKNVRSFEETNYPLTLMIIPRGQVIRFQMNYFKDSFSQAEIEKVFVHLETAIRSVLNDPLQSPAKVSILSEAEREEVLISFNSTKRVLPSDQTILDLISKHTAETPGNIAIVCRDERVSYAQLNDRANIMRDTLLSKGTRKGDIVALLLDKSIDLVVSVLGIMKAGAAFLPIDATLPLQRIQSIITDAGVEVFISDKADLLEEFESESILLIDSQVTKNKVVASEPISDISVNPDDAAYLIYTSGSTGKPKGVKINHLSLFNYIHWANQYYFDHNPSGGNFPLFTSPAFDLTLSSIFIPLSKGKTIKIYEDTEVGLAVEDIFGPNGALDTVKLTPSHITLLKDIEEGNNQLRTLIVGGEALKDEHVQIVNDKWPGVIIFNEYGPTEATIGCTAIAVSVGKINAGKPIANTSIYVLNQASMPVPIGIKGEIYIGGTCLAKGYMGQPEQSALRFIDSPFEAGQKIYRTGDIGCWLEDGSIQYFGRSDEQVKVRGYRIEPGEIESHILNYPNVIDAAVLPVKNDSAEISLTAFVKMQDPASFNKEDLKGRLQQYLPAYMIPAQYEVLTDFPLTANGKTNKKALISGLKAEEQLPVTYRIPGNPVQEVIAVIWAGILKVQAPGITDNFFELGGHSLNATQMTSRIRAAFKVSIGVKEVLENPTIEELASLIEKLKGGSSENDLPPIVRVTGRERSLLSFAQQRLWFLNRLEGQSSSYNIPEAIKIEGVLNKDALQSAFTEIINRHEILRTNFHDVDGKAYQLVKEAQPFIIPTVTIADKGEQLFYELIANEAAKSFDLQYDQLIRAILIAVSEEEHILFVNMHHIVSDGWSSGVFINELITLYQAYASGDTSPLSPLPIQYADFACWQRTLKNEHFYERQLSYWKNKLSGAPFILDLPTDKPRPAIRTENGSAYRFTVSAEVSAKLRNLSNKQGATLFMTLLSAYSLLLSRYSRQNNLLIGSSIANRNRKETEALIGFFVNIIVYRVELSVADNFLALLEQVKQLAFEAYAHQDIPFDQVIDELQPERDMSYSPIFQVAFNMQNMPMPAFEIPGLRITPKDLIRPIAKYDLYLSMEDTDTGLKGIMEYNNDLFLPSTIEQMAGHFIGLLEKVSENPKQNLKTLPLLNESEYRKIIYDWNSTDRALPAGKTVLDRVTEIAGESPEHIAFEYDGLLLTYQQLEREAENFARYLQHRGLKQGDRVGVIAIRSIRILSAIIGIMKAGGVYVPIDPDYPLDRISFMLSDAEVNFIAGEENILEEFNLPFINNREAVSYTGVGNFIKPVIDPESLAYIIYTSGSTGNPKGVMLRHIGLLNLSIELAKGFLVNKNSKTLQFASLSFDASIAEIFACLHAGATVVMATKAKMLPGPDLISLLESTKITYVIIPPSILKALPYAELPLLETLIVAGEACQPELIAQWGKKRNFINAYGPTEYTVCASLTLCDLDESPLHIGRPIGNTAIYILDENLMPLPPGIPGELFISGTGLSAGYINLAEINSERFIADPFSKKAGAKMYRSGDMAKFLPDGNIYYIGRIDRQVKLRGFRIEPGEIEETLKKYPSVKQAVVQVQQDANRYQRLVAFITEEPVLDEGVISLEEFLQDKLPVYLQPNSIVVLDEIPLTLNGKIDQKALLAYAKGAVRKTNEYTAPRNEQERILARIWQDVLGVEKAGIHHNFFKLGGDSILSIQIVSRARSAGLEFTPKDLFENQTIASLAAVAKQKSKTTAEQGKISGKVPLAPIQQWFFEQQLTWPNHFNQAALLETDQETSAESIERALQKLIAHHDVLRARYYQETGNVWVQEIMLDAADKIFHNYDLTEVTDEEKENKFLEIANDIQAGLSLEKGSVFKATLFKMGNNEPSRLLLIAHHLVIDGVSWRILLEDLFNILGSASKSSLPEKTHSFKDWVEATTAYAKNNISADEINYWKKISNIKTPLVPLDNVINSAGDSSTGIIASYLDERRTENLIKVVPAAYRTHIQEVLLSAFVLSLGQWLKSETVTIQLEGHGRESLVDDLDISRTIGWFTSAFPAVFTMPENAGAAEILQSIKQQYRGIPNKGVGYGLLRYLSNESESFALGLHPQVIFNYLGQSGTAIPENNGWRLSDADCGFEQSPDNRPLYLLSANLIIINGQLKIGIEYDKSQLRDSTIHDLVSSFISNLHALIDHCMQPEAAGISPVDFPVSVLNEQNLSLLAKQIKESGYSLRDIADVYPLAPLQQGLLFESLLNPSSVSYREQLSVTIQGKLNARLFKKAWQNVINKYDIFRTAFFWDGLDNPAQVVYTKADIIWNEASWADKNEIKTFLDSDIQQSFTFLEPALMRFQLSHLPNNEWFFCWTHHHILMDGWCLPIILREVFDQYEALTSGTEPQISYTRPYVNFINWLAKQDEAAAKQWWDNYLSGFHHATPFGIDQHKDLSGKSVRMQECIKELGPELENSLKQLSQNEGVTLNILVHAAWALLLGRYSGTDDVVFGATVSGRPPELEGVEKMVGLFINSVPVRVGINNDKELSEWLQDLQAKQLERDNYSYTSLTKIREYSGVTGSEPLFESLIIFENYPVDKSVDEGISDLTIGEVQFSEQTHYPITLMVLPGNALTFRISYDASRFAEETIDRLLHHLFNILKEFSAGIDQALGKVSLADQEETTLILDTFNAREPMADIIQPVSEAFAAHASIQPDTTALLFDGENYSYGEINSRANKLADYLLSTGLKTGELVALCMDRSPEMVICLLAILKSGAAYLPLDPKFPAERLHYMLHDSKASLLLTEQKYGALWQQEEVKVLTTQEIQGGIDAYKATELAIKVTLESLAYVIYTSGSTGKPKGVQISHGALSNFLASMQAEPGITAHDVLLAVTTISFDIAGLEIFLPLISGATLALLPDEIAADPVRLIACLQKIKPTIMQATPTTWQMLLNNGWEGSASLKTLCGGEALPNELARELVNRTQSVWNMYGPTETTIWSAVLQIDPEQHLAANGYALIGGPIANTQFYILNNAMQPVPIGVAGELYIGGKGLAKGYLGQPELTSGRFIANPFAVSPDDLIYRTGDLAKWAPNGTITFLGRIDQQVKIRGFRIETGEIESVIKEIVDVNEAVVIAGKDNQHNDCLLAFMIMEQGKNVSSTMIREVLAARLPAYMIPSAFTSLDKLPLTPNGKIDRKALKENYKVSVLVDDNYLPPANQLQQKLHAIWTLVLGLPQIGIRDNFFSLGGHSLLATQCMSRVRAEFEVDMPLKKLFDYPDIESFAIELQLLINETKGRQVQAVVPDNDNEVFEF